MGGEGGREGNEGMMSHAINHVHVHVLVGWVYVVERVGGGGCGRNRERERESAYEGSISCYHITSHDISYTADAAVRIINK